MIYVDSSVALAWLFTEPRNAPDSFWDAGIISSRLLEYEVWNRIHARGFTRTHRGQVLALIAKIEMVELLPETLTGALRPLPLMVRTLDALHIATVEFLRELGRPIELASFDKRMIAAARSLGIPLHEF